MADIDRLDEASALSRLFSVDRWNIFSLSTADHGPMDGSSLRDWIDGIADEHSMRFGRVRLLAFPRIFGYVFNPIALWFCEDDNGQLRAIVYEVRNTFGEHHSYVMPVDDAGPAIHEWSKAFHVSPFIGMDADYRFRVENPSETLRVSVKENDSEGPLFSATMTGEQTELSTANLARLLVTHPLMTVKVIAGIHWEALQLWRKGATFRRRPPAPSSTISAPAARR